ncbi:nuclear hormone receptor HR96-like [Ornithodoros turicata]
MKAFQESVASSSCVWVDGQLVMAEEKLEPKLCGVCSDKAFGYNFGALTCESCKAFFRRNALRNKEFRCLFKNDCEVNTRTRRFCQRCRLQKCFALGMKKECILTEAEKQEKRAKIEENRLKRAFRNEDGMPDTPLSSITDEEDEPPPKIAHTADPQVKSEPEDHLESRSLDALRVTCRKQWENGSQLVRERAVRSQFPHIEGRTLTELELTRIQELATANEVLKLPLACDPDPSLVDVINMTDHAIRRLIKMSKRIAAFKTLCQEDQVALLKGGSTELMLLRSVMSYDAERDCWKGPDPRLMSIKLDILKEARGNVYEEHKRFINAFRPEWRVDENIMLLLSAITLFTPERPNLVHRDVVMFEQDTYLYLLRRYLDTIYTGCESRSVFLHLMRNLEDMRTLNENQVSILVDLNPREVEPLLIEIFDLK